MNEHPGGDFFTDVGLIKQKQDTYSREDITGVIEESYKDCVRKRMMAVGLINRGNQKNLENSWQRSENSTPSILTCTPKH